MSLAFPYAELHAFPDGDAPHTGNPAGVMLLDRDLADGDLLGMARSNNLSETAYLKALDTDLWGLRWFTPGHEVDLCGHATLASAVWLFEEGRVAGEEARFETRSGRLTVRRTQGGLYEMNFPEVATRPAEPHDGVVAALGAAAPSKAFEVERIHGSRFHMLVYANEADIAAMRPDFGALAATGINVVATAPGARVHFVSRFFCPAAGIDEDPVTGSAHCALAPYGAQRLGFAERNARQTGPRPGALSVRTGADGRVRLIGTAKRYLDGTITL